MPSRILPQAPTKFGPKGPPILANQRIDRAILSLEHFRFRVDDGGQATAPWMAATDTNVSATLGRTLRLRLAIRNVGDRDVYFRAPGGTLFFGLRYRPDSSLTASPWNATTSTNDVRGAQPHSPDFGGTVLNQVTTQQISTGPFTTGVLLNPNSQINSTLAVGRVREDEFVFFVHNRVPTGTVIEFSYAYDAGSVPIIVEEYPVGFPTLTAVAEIPAAIFPLTKLGPAGILRGPPILALRQPDPVVTGGATIFPWTLTADPVGTTASIVKQVNTTISTTVGNVASIVKQVATTLTASTVGNAASIVKQVNKILTATAVANVASMSTPKTIVQTLSATVGNVASMVKSVGKILSTTVGNAASIIKQVNKTLSAIVGNVASMSAIKVILLTMSATVGNAASMVRSVGKILSASVGTTPSMSRVINKTLSATSATTASLIKSVQKTLSATSAAVGSLAVISLKPLQAASNAVSALTASLSTSGPTGQVFQATSNAVSSFLATFTLGKLFSTAGRDSLYYADETKANYIIFDATLHRALDGHEPTYEAALARLRRHSIKTGGQHQLLIKRVECK